MSNIRREKGSIYLYKDSVYEDDGIVRRIMSKWKTTSQVQVPCVENRKDWVWRKKTSRMKDISLCKEASRPEIGEWIEGKSWKRRGKWKLKSLSGVWACLWTVFNKPQSWILMVLVSLHFFQDIPRLESTTSSAYEQALLNLKPL